MTPPLHLIPPIRARDSLLGSVFLLLVVGVVMVFSASAFHRSVDGDPFFFLRRQLLWLPIAGLIGAFFCETDYRLFQRYYGHLLLVTVVLLSLVLVPELGREVNRSRRWLPLGGGLQFQPSELAKLSVVLFVAGFLTVKPERRRRLVTGFVPVVLVVLCVFGLILVEPDLGTSVFVLALAASMLLLAKVRILYLVSSALVFVPLLALYVSVRWEMIRARLQGVLEPQEVYQVRQSLVALGSGGLGGVGLGAGGQKLRYLPEAHTDFILAVVGEELGFLGCAAVIVLFVVIVWSGGAIALRARDDFGFLVAAGITFSLGLQAAMNVAVVTGSAPTKGIALPFVSFGGSGLCMTLAQIGVLLSIARGAETGPTSADRGRLTDREVPG